MPRTSRASIRRRIALAAVLLAALLVVFVGRLFDLQVVRAEALTAEAVGRRSAPITVYGTRGDIITESGVVLAATVERFNIVATPVYVAAYTEKYGVQATKDAVRRLADATGASSRSIMQSITADPESYFAFVAKDVSYDALTDVRALGIPWVDAQLAPRRTYPNGALAGNLTGFMSTDGPGAGLELAMDKCLASRNGVETYEQSGDGVRLPGSTVIEKPAVDGSDVVLTIDPDLQYFAQQVIAEQADSLGAAFATAVVVEVKTGKLLAVAEGETVDPNNPGATGEDTWTSWSFSRPYEPGSVIKPLTMASLLDLGKVTPRTQVEVPGVWYPGGELVVRDALAHAAMPMTATGVLVNSSNVGMAKLSTRMSARQLQTYEEAFGLGRSTGALPGLETGGILAPYQLWDDQTRLNVSYGAGLSVSAAQLAGAYQAIANDGVKLPLRLVEGCRGDDGTMTHTPKGKGSRVVSRRAAVEVQHMLENVLTKGQLATTASVPGYRVGIKTGTAEVAQNGVYTDDRFISMVGIAPIEDPQYVVLTTFGYPDATHRYSAAAAPAFRTIMAQVLKTYRVLPSTSKASDLPISY